MIARSWHGCVPSSFRCGFEEYLRATGVAAARSTPGCIAVKVAVKDDVGYSHFYMISYWEDMSAVQRFAGDAPSIAVAYPDDAAYQLISDPLVLHHVVDAIPDREHFSD